MYKGEQLRKVESDNPNCTLACEVEYLAPECSIGTIELFPYGVTGKPRCTFTTSPDCEGGVDIEDMAELISTMCYIEKWGRLPGATI